MAQAGVASLGGGGFDWNSLTKQFARGEYALGLGVMALIVMLIVPLPPFLLDFMLSISITVEPQYKLERHIERIRDSSRARNALAMETHRECELVLHRMVEGAGGWAQATWFNNYRQEALNINPQSWNFIIGSMDYTEFYDAKNGQALSFQAASLAKNSVSRMSADGRGLTEPKPSGCLNQCCVQ